MNSGDIMSRIDGDSEQFLHVIQRNLFHFVNSILLCAGVVVMVARINLVIAGMLIVAAALPIVMTRLCGRLTERYARDRRGGHRRLYRPPVRDPERFPGDPAPVRGALASSQVWRRCAG